uniref:Serine-threonine/tyrosine-protein kinase catalytic domain-containing protein n=2 Tax=Amphimedon queenslandica TaxID=400682 RepID=A0A1X7VP13_AMPQE
MFHQRRQEIHKLLLLYLTTLLTSASAEHTFLMLRRLKTTCAPQCHKSVLIISFPCFERHSYSYTYGLLWPPTQLVPPLTADNTKWQIDKSALSLSKELGSGQFGQLNGIIKLMFAIKILKEGAMNENDFIGKAKSFVSVDCQVAQ